jgi:hypothetical protein
VAIARAIDKAAIGLFAKVRLSCLHLRRELAPSLYALVIRHFEVRVDPVIGTRLILGSVNPLHV